MLAAAIKVPFRVRTVPLLSLASSGRRVAISASVKFVDGTCSFRSLYTGHGIRNGQRYSPKVTTTLANGGTSCGSLILRSLVPRSLTTHPSSNQPLPPQSAVTSTQSTGIIHRILFENPTIAPYSYLLRLQAPIGTYLLYLPCTWGVAFGAYAGGLGLENAAVTAGEVAWLMTLLGVGSLVMRGAGCVVNDLWDRELDKKVERTRTRPIASGVISPKAAMVFLGSQLSLGLGVLLQLNLYTIKLGFLTVPLFTMYPFMKRITHWPQFVLGLAFNSGTILGCTALLGHADWNVLVPLYAAGVSWTLVYDTIYALQDKKDDLKAGIRSTALLFSSNGTRSPKPALGFFATTTVSLLALAGYMNAAGPLFYLISVVGSMAHFGWQLKTLNVDCPRSANKKFRSNALLGAIVTAGVFADVVWRAYSKDSMDSAPDSTEQAKVEYSRVHRGPSGRI
ncbi:UbiA prenyltransferase family-domain-containing protein [Gaertneriomyces semiglobifer]|nr:UbiA prenyltransferase family-domain-containing protein [Gaertneriomyces semiglobifer]